MKEIKNFIWLFIVLTTLDTSAQQSEDLFKTANGLYQKEQYSDALLKYKEIEEHQLTSDALFYNMANAYYKLNKIAPAL